MPSSPSFKSCVFTACALCALGVIFQLYFKAESGSATSPSPLSQPNKPTEHSSRITEDLAQKNPTAALAINTPSTTEHLSILKPNRQESAAQKLIFNSSSLRVVEPLPNVTLPAGATPRHLPAKGKAPKPRHHSDILVVKFHDALAARPNSNRLEFHLNSDDPRTGELTDLSELLQQHSSHWSPHFQNSAHALEKITSKAFSRTQVMQPDLLGIVRLAPKNRDLKSLEMLALALHRSSLTEFVEFHGRQPVKAPEDYPPTTEDFTQLQTWQDPDPGLNAKWAWSQNILGQGVGFYDVEQAAHISHEDLVDASLEYLRPLPPHQLPPNSNYPGGPSYRHGTASLGCTLAQHNSYGMNGVAPLADGHFATAWSQQDTYEPDTSIAECIADASEGDVILLEVQTNGPDGANDGVYPDYVPLEYYSSTWNLTRAASDAGIIIVAAAGNGNVNLDHTLLTSYSNRGDSGAIIVGAGDSDLTHNKRSSSTYGSRVNVHAWGVSVATTGYTAIGPSYSEIFDTYEDTDDRTLQKVLQGYAPSWSGTSSASACIAAICVGIQSHAKNVLQRPLTPLEMRTLLVQNSTPQGTGGNIGPIPNMRKALEAIDQYYRPSQQLLDHSLKYHIPSSAVLADSWKATEFDDSSWITTTGALGYDATDNSLDSHINTDLQAQLYDVTTSVYLREEFTVDPLHAAELNLKLFYDDGVAVYLNGNEIFRSPLVTQNPAWDFSQQAIRNDEDTLSPTVVKLKGSPHLLAGRNVIAIHALNNRGTYLGGDWPNYLFQPNDEDFYIHSELDFIPIPLTFNYWGINAAFDATNTSDYTSKDLLAYSFNNHAVVDTEKITHSAQDYLKVTYTRYKGGNSPAAHQYLIGDLTYTLQTSSSLQSSEWQTSLPTPSDAVTGQVENLTAVDLYTEKCTVYLPLVGDAMFARVEVVLDTP